MRSGGNARTIRCAANCSAPRWMGMAAACAMVSPWTLKSAAEASRPSFTIGGAARGRRRAHHRPRKGVVVYGAEVHELRRLLRARIAVDPVVHRVEGAHDLGYALGGDRSDDGHGELVGLAHIAHVGGVGDTDSVRWDTFLPHPRSPGSVQLGEASVDGI